jgi:hypothetical protein
MDLQSTGCDPCGERAEPSAAQRASDRAQGHLEEGEFYVAKFRANGETKRLGSFKTLEEAIVRYNWEVLQKTGPIGRLNSIEEVQNEVRSEVAA